MGLVTGFPATGMFSVPKRKTQRVKRDEQKVVGDREKWNSLHWGGGVCVGGLIFFSGSGNWSSGKLSLLPVFLLSAGLLPERIQSLLGANGQH